MTKKILFTFVLASLAASPLAYAESRVGLGGEMKVNTTVSGGTGVAATNHIIATTTLMPTKGVRSEGGVNTAVGIKMEDGSDIEIEANEEMHASSSRERDDEKRDMHSDEHAIIALGKVELHLSDEDTDDNSTTSIESATEVHSDVDLKHFVSGKAKKDERIKNVDVKDGTVEVDYDVPAKLFGFINFSVSTHASADAKGNVHVAYPWYMFLMSTTESSTEIETGVKADVSANANANVAHVFAILVKHLEASGEVSAAVK